MSSSEILGDLKIAESKVLRLLELASNITGVFFAFPISMTHVINMSFIWQIIWEMIVTKWTRMKLRKMSMIFSS